MIKRPLRRRLRLLATCAPFADKPPLDRRMRAAVSRARKTDDFVHQQEFDRAIGDLVQTIPTPPEISEWFANEHLATGVKRTWRMILLNPAVIAITIAVLVIAVVSAYKFYERLNTFPGAETAKKLLVVASATRISQLEPMQVEAGALGDFFFMKHRLERYDVPPEFAAVKTIGLRVFDDEEGQRVAQIAASEKRLQFFFFPAPRDPKTGRPEEFAGWRFVEHEGWTGAVQQRNAVCFMACLRGGTKDLAGYLPKSND